MKLSQSVLALTLAAGLSFSTPAFSSDATFTTLSLTPETALKLAQAALKSCRDQGFQVAVAVIDKGGSVQVLLRDRYAGMHTPDTATRKAWTAVSFRANTSSLAASTQSGQPSSGARDVTGALMLGGGVLIEADGGIIGGVGVSGAPAGELDEGCAKAGLDAIVEDLM
jgi:uncharacterized protein GlcG (DUF336 family)